MIANNVIKKSPRIPTVLIAGGAGFVGSHLCEALLKKSARVVVVDNFQTGKKSSVNHLLNNPKFALYDTDVNQGLPKDIESVDYVIHLAGLEEYLYSKEMLNLDLLLTNSIGTKNLLDLAVSSQAKFLLVSSLDVYTGMMSQIELSTYFGKTQPEERKYSLTEAKRYAEALVWEYHNKHNLDARIVRLPEIYGPKMSLDSSGNLGILLRDLLEGKNLTIFGDGGQKEYYTYYTDAINGILKSLFEKNTAGSIFTLVDKEPISALELAFLIKSLADRPTDIKFESSASLPYLHSTHPDTLTLSKLDWKPKISLKDGLIATLGSLGYKTNEHSFKPNKLVEEKKLEKSITSLVPPLPEVKDAVTVTDVLPPVSRDKPKLPKLKLAKPNVKQLFGDKSLWYSVLGVVVALLLVFIILPFTQTYFFVVRGQKSAAKVQTYVMQLDMSSAQEESVKTVKNFANASNSFNKSEWLFRLFGKSKKFDSMSYMLSSVTYFSRGVYNLAEGFAPLGDVWQVIQPSSTTSLDPNLFAEAKLHILEAKSNTQLARADFRSVDVSQLPASYSGKVAEYEKYLNSTDASLDNLGAVVGDLPQLLGLGSEVKYLILFQNNNELRPTGGFIGSYAVLTIKDGKMVDLKIDDIYNPDGQIDEQGVLIAPPKPITDFLVEDRLYMRNANFNPDFRASADLISDLYTRVTGDEIAGVFAIDLDFVKNILDVTGPVFLTAYNEEITSENLYERTQLHSDFNYQEGVSQKKSFLTVLGSKLLEKLFSLEDDKVVALSTAVGKSLQERHAALYVQNGQAGVILNDLGWDGSLEKSSGDYIQVVNANLGGTKSNYYVDQKYKYTVSSDTRDGLLRGEMRLTYTHNGESSAWPGGPYTDYVRLLTAPGAKLTGAQVVNPQTGESKDIFEDIVIDSVGEYVSFETSFTLQPKDTTEIVYQFDLPAELSLTPDHKSYNLLWQKQAGTTDDNFEFVFDYPFGMQITSLEPQMKSNDDIISTSGALNTDQAISVSFK